MDTLPVSYPCLPVIYPRVKNISKTMLASVRYPTGTPIQDIGHLRIAGYPCRPDVRCGSMAAYAAGPSNHLFHRGGLSWLNLRPGWRKVKRTAMKREQKITLGEMRAAGPTHLLVCCGDYKYAHSHVVDAWTLARSSPPVDLPLLKSRQACGK